MNLTLDSIQAAVVIGTTIGGFLITAGTIFWRFSQKLSGMTQAQESVSAELGKMRAQIAQNGRMTRESIDAMGKRIVDLERGFAAQAAILNEREKDNARLGGQVDQLSGLIVKQVAAVQGTVSSLDALWRTLQTLFPEKVPRRMSDRG